jgi:hypothetical protein
VTDQECRDRVRCALSDRTGTLRFESFDIVDAPDCAQAAATLRHYLLGRALAEADPDHIRESGREAYPLCARVVAQLVQESQEILIRGPTSTFRRARRGSGSAV